MKKGQIWKDRSGGFWEIKVVDERGQFPIGAKSLSQDRAGFHLFTIDGRFQADDNTMFDLVEHVRSHRATSKQERDDIFIAACHAMSAGMLAIDAVDAAIKLVCEFNARVRS